MKYNLTVDFEQLAPHYKADFPMIHLGKLADDDLRLVTQAEFDQACEDRLNDDTPFEGWGGEVAN